LLSLDSIFYKLVPDLLGRNLDTKLDLFYGEEIFSFSHDKLDERVKTVADYLDPGGRLVTNDPTLPPGKTVSTPAYVLMQTIDGYPQPLDRDLITNTFQKHSLTTQTIGDNWIIAGKESVSSG
jgi:hypothetical protein